VPFNPDGFELAHHFATISRAAQGAFEAVLRLEYAKYRRILKQARVKPE
jgi:hypothetical protein